jgi:hypothetical protein
LPTRLVVLAGASLEVLMSSMDFGALAVHAFRAKDMRRPGVGVLARCDCVITIMYSTPRAGSDSFYIPHE